MENIRNAVSAYNIYPAGLKEVTDRLYQVSTRQQEYALKQSRMSKRALSDWKNVYNLASKHNIKSILPVYLTRSSALFTEQNDMIYYLSPWIVNKMQNDVQTTQVLAECIAEVHAKTKKVYRVEPAPIIETFSDYQKRCSTMHQQLLNYVEMFEQNRFMSPFELQVCTHYHVVNEVFQELTGKIEQFSSELDETAEWNYSLCHGNLNESHILHGDHPYLINWENASYDNATTDLIQFFNYQVLYKNQSSETLMDCFYDYLSGNPLKQHEMYLLAISALNPQSYIKMIDAYHDHSSGAAMVHRTQELEYAFRQLQFGLYCSNWLEKYMTDSALDDS